MSHTQILVILAAIALPVLIAWYFCFARRVQTHATVDEYGFQCQMGMLRGKLTVE